MRGAAPARPELPAHVPELLRAVAAAGGALLRADLRRPVAAAVEGRGGGPGGRASAAREVDAAHVALHHRRHRHRVGLHLPDAAGAATARAGHAPVVRRRRARWPVGDPGAPWRPRELPLQCALVPGFVLEGWR